MAKPSRTWGILDPHKLPDAEEVPNMLGSVILDVRQPQHDVVPSNVQEFMRPFSHLLARPTVDTSFHALCEHSTSKSLFQRLGEILEAKYGKSSSRSQVLATENVRTHWLKNPNEVFEAIKSQHSADLDRLFVLSSNRKRSSAAASSSRLDRPGTLYMIVGIKTCLDASLTNTTTSSKSNAVGGRLPVGSTLTSALTGGIGPVLFDPAPLTDPGIGISRSQNHETGSSYTVHGERIFAIECLLIMRGRQWKRTKAPPTPPPLNQQGDGRGGSGLGLGLGGLRSEKTISLAGTATVSKDLPSFSLDRSNGNGSQPSSSSSTGVDGIQGGKGARGDAGKGGEAVVWGRMANEELLLGSAGFSGLLDGLESDEICFLGMQDERGDRGDGDD